MITNNSLTIYHLSGLDNETHLEVWTRYNYSKAWIFKTTSGVLNKGYDSANNIEIRLPYNENDNLNISNFAIGDIIVEGTISLNITTQKDLKEYQIFKIESINNNNFGNNQHIHLGGK